MSGNPKDSRWRSTPNALRKRKEIKLTLSPEALEKLDTLGVRFGSRSAAVEKLILEAKEDVPRRKRRTE